MSKKRSGLPPQGRPYCRTSYHFSCLEAGYTTTMRPKYLKFLVSPFVLSPRYNIAILPFFEQN